MPDFFEEWKQRYSAEDLAGDADQTEWEAIRLGVTNVDTGIRDQILSGELETSSAREERSTRVTDEIERRSAILGDLYPFERTGNSLRYRPSDSHVYEFCLSISFVGSLSTTFGRRFQIGFERLTRDVMACLLGRARVLARRTGEPGDGLENRPSDIKGILQELSEACGGTEWRWAPLQDYPSTPASQDLGDLGLDAIVCKPFADQRGGDLFLVAQCACGLTDWSGKFNEPDYGRLSGWMRPVTHAPFVRVFAVPFHIPNVSFLAEVSRRARALAIDRTRIVLLADQRGNRRYIRTMARESYAVLVRDSIAAGRVALRARRRRRQRGAGARRSR